MRGLFQRLRERLFGIPVGTIILGARRGQAVMMSETDFVREAALDVLEKHGIRAHFYMPAAHTQDEDLADALRLLSGRGYIMTVGEGRLVGAVAAARLSANDNAQQRRAEFKVIENN